MLQTNVTFEAVGEPTSGERGMTVDPFYSESNMKHLDKSIKQLVEGKVVIKTIEELEAMEDR